MRRCFLKPSILLPRSLFDALVEQRTLRQPRETGGFLLGVRRGPHLEITHHTAQGWSDIATRSSFERRGAHHQRDAEAIWRRTVGEVGLIGDCILIRSAPPNLRKLIAELGVSFSRASNSLGWA